MNLRPVVVVALSCSLLAAWTRADPPPPSAEEFRVTDLDTPPILKRPVPPVYPYNMRLAGLEGAVVLEYIVGPDGSVVEAFVVRSNNPWFERPAIDAVLKWKFSPGKKAGRGVFTRVQQSVQFHLDGGGQSLWTAGKAKSRDALPPEFRWDVPPETVHSMFPVYPFADLQAKRSGKAQIRFFIDPRGRVAQSQLVSATTPDMGLAALAAIDGWRFNPARKADGTPSWAVFGLEFGFDRNGGDAPVTDSADTILRLLKKPAATFAQANELDAPLRPLSRRPPVYPSSLQNQGQAGEALIEFYIDARGDAQLPRIVSASAPEFGYAAAQAVATWRFKAPTRQGKAATVRVQVPVNFKLAEEKP